MAAGTVQVIPMEAKHLDDVVRIHLRSFSGFFLTILGPDFLRLLYSEILQFPGHVAYVALADGLVAGFVAGVTEQTGFYGKLIRTQWFRFAWAAKGALLRKPSISGRLLRALTYRQQSKSASAQGLLMSIGVLPEYAGCGMGKLLVEEFLAAIRVGGAAAVCLTTDKENNENVNAFYRSMGFTVAREYVTPEGRSMNEYYLDLQSLQERKP